MSIPSSTLVPGTYVTIDSSKAVTGALVGPTTAVVFGQKHSGGTATAETYNQIFSYADAQAKYGRGSMLAEMFKYWFAGNRLQQVYAVSLDDAAGTARADTLTFSGAATEAGTIYLYINGEQIQIGVSSGDADTAVAAAVETAIGTGISDEDYPVIASAASAVVTLTAKNDGTVGNQIDLRLNLNPGEEVPAGLTGVIASSVAGATDPTLADALDAVPDDVIGVWVSPYTDTTSLTAIEAELDFRWQNTVQIDGQAIIAKQDTTANVVTFGGTVDTEHIACMDAGVNAPQGAYLWAAAFAAQVTAQADDDPAVPFRSMTLVNIIGDTDTDKRSFSDRNSILTAGISTHLVSTGKVSIERSVTTYKTNAVGSPDTAYQNLNTPFNLSFMRQSLKNRIETRFPQHKLADDGTVFGAGQPIVTPSVMKAELVDLYEDWIELGLAENLAAFKDSMIVERDGTNRSRLNSTINPILVGQFYQLDLTLQFIL